MQTFDPSEFSGKSSIERLGLLTRSGVALMMIVGVVAFSLTLAMVVVLYGSQRQQEYSLSRIKGAIGAAEAQSRMHVDAMQQSIAGISQLALRVGVRDPESGRQLLSEIERLQKEVAALGRTYDRIYRDLDGLFRSGPLHVSGSVPGIDERSSGLSLSLIASAFAQGPTPPATNVTPTQRKFTQEDARLYVMLTVFVVLGLTFVISIVAIFMATNPDVLKFAFDTIKTLMGFFIGVATAFLGLPLPPTH